MPSYLGVENVPRRSEGCLVLLCKMRQFQTLLRQVLRIEATPLATDLLDPLRIVACATVLASILARPVYWIRTRDLAKARFIELRPTCTDLKAK